MKEGNIIGIIYCATNKVNGKMYIGQTINTMEVRMRRHKYDNGKRESKFQTAITKYGWESFDWEELEQGIPRWDLTRKEKYYIKKYNTYEEGYNGNLGGSMYERGEDNSYNKYSKNKVMGVIDDVEGQRMKHKDISRKHGVPVHLVSSISKGECYTYLWDYPKYARERDVTKFTKRGEEHHRNKYKDETWEKVKLDINTTTLTLKEISEKRGVNYYSVLDFSKMRIKRHIWGEDKNERDVTEKTKDEILHNIYIEYYLEGKREVDVVISNGVSRGVVTGFIKGISHKEKHRELVEKYGLGVRGDIS